MLLPSDSTMRVSWSGDWCSSWDESHVCYQFRSDKKHPQLRNKFMQRCMIQFYRIEIYYKCRINVDLGGPCHGNSSEMDNEMGYQLGRYRWSQTLTLRLKRIRSRKSSGGGTYLEIFRSPLLRTRRTAWSIQTWLVSTAKFDPYFLKELGGQSYISRLGLFDIVRNAEYH